MLWPQPKSEFAPAHWNCEAAKAALDPAGSNFETTRTLVCAYQMILPGKIAPSHGGHPDSRRPSAKLSAFANCLRDVFGDPSYREQREPRSLVGEAHSP